MNNARRRLAGSRLRSPPIRIAAAAAAPISAFESSAKASASAARALRRRERESAAASRLTNAADIAKSAAKAYGKRNELPLGAPMQIAAAIVTAAPAESGEPARRARR